MTTGAILIGLLVALSAKPSLGQATETLVGRAYWDGTDCTQPINRTFISALGECFLESNDSSIVFTYDDGTNMITRRDFNCTGCDPACASGTARVPGNECHGTSDMAAYFIVPNTYATTTIRNREWKSPPFTSCASAVAHGTWEFQPGSCITYADGKSQLFYGMVRGGIPIYDKGGNRFSISLIAGEFYGGCSDCSCEKAPEYYSKLLDTCYGGSWGAQMFDVDGFGTRVTKPSNGTPTAFRVTGTDHDWAHTPVHV